MRLKFSNSENVRYIQGSDLMDYLMPEVKWSEVPLISDWKALAVYMRSETAPGKIQECIPVGYSSSFQPDTVKAVFTNTGIAACLYSNIHSDKEKNEYRII